MPVREERNPLEILVYSPNELLGHLNETEKKNAPKALYVAGDAGFL